MNSLCLPESALVPSMDGPGPIRTDGDPRRFRETFNLDLRDCPGRMEAIGQAVYRGDPASLARAADSLKGVLAGFGPSEALDMADRLEIKGRTRNLRGVKDEFRALEDRVVRLNTALERLAEGVRGMTDD